MNEITDYERSRTQNYADFLAGSAGIQRLIETVRH